MNKTNPHHKDTFFQRLQFHILRNVEIIIENIHIAFDDKTTKSYPFQFGITLNYIKLNVILEFYLNKIFFILLFLDNK